MLNEGPWDWSADPGPSPAARLHPRRGIVSVAARWHCHITAASLRARARGRRSATFGNHVAEGEVHAGSYGTARLRHPVPPLRDGVARDEQQAPGCEVLGRARAGPVTELEAAARTEAHRGDVRLAAVAAVAVTGPSHGVAAIAIEIREH